MSRHQYPGGLSHQVGVAWNKGGLGWKPEADPAVVNSLEAVCWQIAHFLTPCLSWTEKWLAHSYGCSGHQEIRIPCCQHLCRELTWESLCVSAPQITEEGAGPRRVGSFFTKWPLGPTDMVKKMRGWEFSPQDTVSVELDKIWRLEVNKQRNMFTTLSIWCQKARWSPFSKNNLFFLFVTSLEESIHLFKCVTLR